MASFCSESGTNHDAAMQPLAQRVIRILLQKRGVPSLAQADSVPQSKLLDLAGEINRFGSTAGLVNEAADTLVPLFAAHGRSSRLARLRFDRAECPRFDGLR